MNVEAQGSWRERSLANYPVTVMVTAIGGGGHGEQILKALRMADRGRYRIVGADMNPMCPQFALADEPIVLPAATAADYFDQLLDACSRFSVQALFHGCEPELRVFSENRDRILAAGILLPINSSETIALCMDKLATMRFLHEAGFDPPKFWVATSFHELEDVDTFPVVIKPSIGSGGSSNVHIAQSPKELRLYAELLRLKQPNTAFIIQEYVGTPEDEYTVGVLHDLNGGFLNSIGLRREIKSTLNIRLKELNQTPRPELGPSLVISSGLSHGQIGPYPEVTHTCEAIAQSLGARGAINIQCRLVGGKVKVFEINPRFSGTTSICAMMGYNEPDVLIRKHLLGEAISPRFRYETGTVIRTIAEHSIKRAQGQ